MRVNVDRLSREGLRASREAWWSADFDAFLWSAFSDVRPARILDVGSGTGTFARRFTPRLPSTTQIIGLDIDLPRLGEAARRERVAESEASAAYLSADGCRLPFDRGTFGVSLTVLTLQRVSEPTRILTEMRRVTQGGGVVVAVEADNLGQRCYLPAAAPQLDRALEAYWRRVQRSRSQADIGIGPRLPQLFHRAGLPSPSVKGYLVTHAVWLEPRAFIDQARLRFEHVARQYAVEDTAECRALIEAIEAAAGDSPTPFYSIAAVPLFMAIAGV